MWPLSVKCVAAGKKSPEQRISVSGLAGVRAQPEMKLHFSKIHFSKIHLWKIHFWKNTLLKKKNTFESAISLPIVSVCYLIDVWDLPQLKLLQNTSFSSKTTKILHFYPKLQKSCDNSLWYLLLIVLLLGCALGFCM